MRICLGFALAVTLSAAVPGLDQVRSVYLLPMANGLDQYLASRLTQSGAGFAIVADPQRADAILTDHLGPTFEEKLLELYPPPAPPEPPKEEKSATSAGKKGDKEPKKDSKDEPRTRPVTSFSRGKGNLFLVDRQTKQVLWSAYRLPKSTRPADLNKLADRLTDDLRKDRTGVK